MNLLALYIVLIEKRRLLRAAVSAIASVSLLLPGLELSAADAAPDPGNAAKVAPDLRDEARGAGHGHPTWSRDIGGVRHVQAILVTQSADPSMADLRAYVLRLG